MNYHQDDYHLAGYCGDEDAHGGPDEGAGVPHGGETLRLDEHRHLGGELGEVRLDVVLEDEAGQGPGGVILVGHLGQDIDEIIVKVRILIELLKLGLNFSLCGRVGTLRFLKINQIKLMTIFVSEGNKPSTIEEFGASHQQTAANPFLPYVNFYF